MTNSDLSDSLLPTHHPGTTFRPPPSLSQDDTMQSCLNSTLICLSYGSLLSKLSQTNPSAAAAPVTVAATGVDNNKSAVPSGLSSLHVKSDRLSGLFQNSTPSNCIATSACVPSSPSAISSNLPSHHHHHKMTGGIRRTVSSAAPSTGGMGSMNTSARPVQQQQQQAPIGVTKSLSSNTQTGAVRGVGAPTATHITSSKDPHKKLDRSFSEPAEKKNSSGSQAAASSLGPSSRYKTELCRSFAEVGTCKYGDKCQFAHGDEEMRTVSRHPKFKTENCKSFHSTGFCPYGPRCHFIHNDESKTRMMNSSGGNNNNCSSNNNSAVSAVPSSPSAIVGSQRMFEPVIGGGCATNQSVISNHNQHVPTRPFPVTSPTAVLNNGNLVRPKALSLGSYSLGSSGEISSPSSQSGSPTSLNSFFNEDAGFLSGTPFGLNGSNSRLHSTALTSAFPPSSHHQNPHSPFSFSPDSAFVSFNGANSNNGSTSSSSSLSFGGSQKCIFGGSQPTLSSRFSPVEHLTNGCDESNNSLIYSLLLGSNPFGAEESSPSGHHHQQHQQQQFSDLYRTMSPIGKPMHYPLAPESPVDSVASEIEALKLGEPHGFAPISPSFSTSSLSTSSSPPNGTLLHSELEALTASSFGPVNIPRLPTFTKFAATIGAAGQLTSAHD